jgi:hypothetical protein
MPAPFIQSSMEKIAKPVRRGGGRDFRPAPPLPLTAGRRLRDSRRQPGIGSIFFQNSMEHY